MKTAKKVLTTVSLATMSFAVAMLIGGVFGLKIFSNQILLNMLLSFATVSLASAFAISSLNLIKKQKTVSIISLILLFICLVFALIIYWSNFQIPAWFGKSTIIISVTTILFIIIVSASIKLGNRHRVLQGITFGLITVLDIIIAIAVFGVPVFELAGFVQIFVVACLVVFALLCTLGILGKKSLEPEPKTQEKGFVKISVDEYESLKAEIKKLKEELEQYKN